MTLRHLQDRYNHDPKFHQLVDSIRDLSEHAQLLPSDLRDAVYLVASQQEFDLMRHTPQMFYPVDWRLERDNAKNNTHTKKDS